MSRNSTTCTWKGCTKGAKHEQISENGEVWANLCAAHHGELNAEIATLRPERMISAWIKAKGGAKAAAAAM